MLLVFLPGFLVPTIVNLKMTQSVYTDYVQQKGYTIAECNRPICKEVPKHLQNRYSTFEEYQEAIHDFLNGN
jgi:hypothetical protein